MKAYKVTTEQMERALAKVNERFDGNIRWNRFEQNGSGFNFTLTVNSSKGKGGRLSTPQVWRNGKQRRIAAACWHVHGHFFEALFEIAPDSYVRSMGRKIDATEGNWKDRNIGNQMFPFQYSDACECDGDLLSAYG